MKARYSLRARADLEEIVEFVGERSPSGARRLISAIRSTIRLVETFPKYGRKQTSYGVRKVGAGKYPYNIYYRIDEANQMIVVLQIRHAARRRQHQDL